MYVFIQNMGPAMSICKISTKIILVETKISDNNYEEKNQLEERKKDKIHMPSLIYGTDKEIFQIFSLIF